MGFTPDPASHGVKTGERISSASSPDLRFEFSFLRASVPKWFRKNAQHMRTTTMNNAGYNSQVPQMPSVRPGCLRLLSVLLFALAGSALATDWSTPVNQLVAKIVAAGVPAAVSLEVLNRSSLGQADLESIQMALADQLSAGSVHLVKAERAAGAIHVTLSENLQSYVWIATIQQGSEPKVVIVSSPRVDLPALIHEPVQFTIRKIQVWSQEQDILDVAIVDSSPPQIIVLDPEKIAIYGFHGQWQLARSFPVSHSRPWPRDLRGRLVLGANHSFNAYLPGQICSSNADQVSVTCRDSDDPWPLGTHQAVMSAFFSPTRNFFTGALAPGVGKDRTVPAFYTAAAIPREKFVFWLFAGVDGQTYEVDGANNQIAIRSNWGSDIAAIKTSCGSGWQILASSNGDGAFLDTIRAYEFPDRDPVPVSQPLDMNGTVTTLWTESSGTGAIAVVLNRRTGKYEAFRVEISCNQ